MAIICFVKKSELSFFIITRFDPQFNAKAHSTRLQWWNQCKLDGIGV